MTVRNMSALLSQLAPAASVKGMPAFASVAQVTKSVLVLVYRLIATMLTFHSRTHTNLPHNIKVLIQLNQEGIHKFVAVCKIIAQSGGFL